jgi:hypothetical protein
LNTTNHAANPPDHLLASKVALASPDKKTGGAKVAFPLRQLEKRRLEWNRRNWFQSAHQITALPPELQLKISSFPTLASSHCLMKKALLSGILQLGS